jgi:hypothetical protein
MINLNWRGDLSIFRKLCNLGIDTLNFLPASTSTNFDKIPTATTAIQWLVISYVCVRTTLS